MHPARCTWAIPYPKEPFEWTSAETNAPLFLPISISCRIPRLCLPRHMFLQCECWNCGARWRLGWATDSWPSLVDSKNSTFYPVIEFGLDARPWTKRALHLFLYSLSIQWRGTHSAFSPAHMIYQLVATIIATTTLLLSLITTATLQLLCPTLPTFTQATMSTIKIW